MNHRRLWIPQIPNPHQPRRLCAYDTCPSLNQVTEHAVQGKAAWRCGDWPAPTVGDSGGHSAARSRIPGCWRRPRSLRMEEFNVSGMMACLGKGRIRECELGNKHRRSWCEDEPASVTHHTRVVCLRYPQVNAARRIRP